jgi:hypothetical protein
MEFDEEIDEIDPGPDIRVLKVTMSLRCSECGTMHDRLTRYQGDFLEFLCHACIEMCRATMRTGG